jgi:hypothetical protein
VNHAEPKTRETTVDVGGYLASIEDDQKRADAHKLVELMSRVTGQPPRMWGANIVGFGRYHYKYASGHGGDSALVGFSPRKPEFSIYLTGIYFPSQEAQREALLARLGKHKIGKACLYVKRFDDINLEVLEELVRMSVDALRAHYPGA